MEIIVKTDPKEIADLIFALQGQPNEKLKLMISKVFSRFCDDFGLHDGEIDELLKKIAMEEGKEKEND